jgi:bacteriorhodopsin
MSETMQALEAGLSIEGITMYLFWVGIVAMGAGAIFFWLTIPTLPKAYQSVNVVAGIICAVACFHYVKMSGIYVESLANKLATGDPLAFPTASRYIDWFITVPLLVLEFPLLLRLGQKGKGLMRNLVGASVVMLVFAWIAETSDVGTAKWWGFYLVSCAAWGFIVFTLYTTVSQRIKEAPAPIARSANTMRLYILVGWSIYPIGFLMSLGGAEFESVREICYNVADVINKVGFGLVCYVGARGLAEMDAEAS